MKNIVWFKKPSEEPRNRDIFGVFRALAAATMACFFSCFSVRDGSRLVSPSTSPQEHVAFQDRSPLSSVFISEENGEGNDLHGNEGDSQYTGTPKTELDLKELREQAEFLKACGTLPETPAEIRKMSVKCKDICLEVEDYGRCRMVDGQNGQSLLDSSIDDSGSFKTLTSIEFNSNQANEETTFQSHMVDGQNGQSLLDSSIDDSGYFNTLTSIEVNSNQANEETTFQSRMVDGQNVQSLLDSSIDDSGSFNTLTSIEVNSDQANEETAFQSRMVDEQNGQNLLDSSIDDSGSFNTLTSIEVNSNQAHEETTFQSCQSLLESSINGSRSFNNLTSIEVNSNQAPEETTSEASPITAPTAQNIKSVHFNCDSHFSAKSSNSSSTPDSQNPKQLVFSGSYNASKNLPYPTPLRLTDDMQTPGTVFTGYLDGTANRKAARIKSQFLKNPPNGTLQLKGLFDEDSNCIQGSPSTLLSSSFTGSGDTPTEASVLPLLGNSSAGNVSKGEASLSSWLKPPSINQEESRHHIGFDFGDNSHYGRTPGDRPILGFVTAHRKDENSSESLKWWDKNGIPNSTHKYKEDQKVSWHATPFEERLEKALSQ